MSRPMLRGIIRIQFSAQVSAIQCSLLAPRTIHARLKASALRKSARIVAFLTTSAFPVPLPTRDSSRIHVLGVGNIGKLFAHALAAKPSPPPITLLLHRASLYEAWNQSEKVIEIVQDGVSNKDGDFDVDLIESVREGCSSSSSNEIIDSLIVATKTNETASAIASIAHRLPHTSTVLFTQNGMGTAEEVCQKVFPDLKARPRYLACVTSHGVYSQGPFSSVHAGMGSVAIADLPTDQHVETQDPAYLLQKILQASLLAAREVSPAELTQLQLEKLVINAMINPLTVIFNCCNGKLLEVPEISRLIRLLLAEASDVVRSLPEYRNISSMQERFAIPRLAKIVFDVAENTAKNTSSMLQDVRAGRPTEIDYINGYITRRGAEIGIDCSSNERLIQLVKDVHVIDTREIEQYFPDYV